MRAFCDIFVAKFVCVAEFVFDLSSLRFTEGQKSPTFWSLFCQLWFLFTLRESAPAASGTYCLVSVSQLLQNSPFLASFVVLLSTGTNCSFLFSCLFFFFLGNAEYTADTKNMGLACLREFWNEFGGAGQQAPRASTRSAERPGPHWENTSAAGEDLLNSGEDVQEDYCGEEESEVDNALEEGGREGEGVTRGQESRMRENSQEHLVPQEMKAFKAGSPRTKSYPRV
jgi:hypothetical protein